MTNYISKMILPIVAAAAMYGCQSGAEREARQDPEVAGLLSKAEQICDSYEQVPNGENLYHNDTRFSETVTRIDQALERNGLEPLEVRCSLIGLSGFKFNVNTPGERISSRDL